jgi:hypothetical protein
MPTPTYTLIDSVTLTSTASSVTFSSISATGKGDLVLSINADQVQRIQFNGDTGTNYYFVTMYGDGTSAVSQSGSDTSVNAGKPFSYTQIMDYSSTNKHKSVLTKRSDSSSVVLARAVRWANTAAINSITIFSGGTSYASGSTFFLYQLVSE